jgi:hypothetical protein
MSDIPAPPPPPPAAPAAPSFDFAKPFTFTFEDPRWINKVLIGGLFVLLGFLIVGWFFIGGYIARMARNIVAGVQHPMPEWDDLGEFFTEGLKLAGVVFIYVVPIMIVAFAMGIPAAIMSDIDNEGMQNLGGGILGCAWCLMVPLSLAVTFFLPASLLMVAMKQDFGAAFRFGEIWAFIRANIVNYLLAIVVYFVARVVGGFGVLLLCIGVIFTIFWEMLITGHAFAQVYRLSTRK